MHEHKRQTNKTRRGRFPSPSRHHESPNVFTSLLGAEICACSFDTTVSAQSSLSSLPYCGKQAQSVNHNLIASSHNAVFLKHRLSFPFLYCCTKISKTGKVSSIVSLPLHQKILDSTILAHIQFFFQFVIFFNAYNSQL